MYVKVVGQKVVEASRSLKLQGIICLGKKFGFYPSDMIGLIVLEKITLVAVLRMD